MEKFVEKLEKYQQLVLETCEKRAGFTVEIVPLVISCLGGGMARVEEQILKLMVDIKVKRRTVREMRKVVSVESLTIMKKLVC